MFLIHWQGYCSSQNTREPKDHLPAKMIKAFENPDRKPVHLQEARGRIGLVFEKGFKVPLQYEELIEICHDVVHFPFSNLPTEIQLTPTDMSTRSLTTLALLESKREYPVLRWSLRVTAAISRLKCHRAKQQR